MRILQVISSFPPAYSYGGALKTAYEISKQLVIDGHNVTVYTTDVYDENSRIDFEENPIIVDGMEVYRFRNISNKLAYKNFPIAPSMAKSLKKNMHKFDIIHLHEYRSFQAILIHYYSKRNNIPYLIQPHGSTINIMGMSKLKNLFDITIGHKILKDASKVIALNERECNIIKKFNVNPSDIKIIPNGISLSEFSNLPDKGNFRLKYGIKKHENLILYLGRIHKIKGIDLLVRTFAKLVNDNIILVIVGPDGGYLQEIKKIVEEFGIKDKVIFTGPLYGSKKLEAYIDADLYVLPSIYETFPSTVLEACACGTPVIVTDNCGISNIVNQNLGFKVRYDEISLKVAIQTMLNNNKIRLNAVNNAKNLLKTRFNWIKIVKELENIYFSEISNNRNSR
ncbi:glycosyltransferase [Methanobacterium formicicum]|uniref:glycosyltransferase n=1 Tax=Methanobacterium formicicum TaxID=2162 RepID=UPI00249205CE|nr:glycosyltransferase [Methanobacterium formicicum]